jgi:Beta-fructosidases (levanase/invertase)
MISKALLDARQYEERAAAEIGPELRPGFHLSARAGWMNDPNGFSYYNGLYHLFYQYHPYDSHWGPMHWGHAVSRDLLHWEYLPAALAPDMPYDREGCYSGTAVALPDGRHMLAYTGVSKVPGPDGRLQEFQTQNLAFGDGLNYEKFSGNPVLTGAELPAGCNPANFRDPKLWRLEDGSFRLLAAAERAGQGGELLLFRSEDAVHWSRVSALAQNGNRLGLMWECPDLFRLDGTDVVLLSAQDMLPKGFEYHNGNGTVVLLGRFDPETGVFTEESDHALDYGIDFYAPETLRSPDGRRIMIGWLQNWDTCNQHFRNYPWFGQMSLPRELSVRNGVLYQRPLRELEALRGEALVFQDLPLENGELRLPGLSGRMLELELELKPKGELYQRFALRFAQDETFHTTVSFRPHESVLKLDRKFSGSRRAIIHQRRAKVRHENGALKLRLILDRYSCEVFVGAGEQVLSMAVDTPTSADGISFFADGCLQISGKAWPLRP